MNAIEELVDALERTALVAYALMQRAENIDRKLAEAGGTARDCELGEITRLRGRLSQNRGLIEKGHRIADAFQAATDDRNRMRASIVKAQLALGEAGVC